ncbi:hypothetical protein E308F_17490 [Moorella sp. E308F]|uniref:hypothetical protein n=1 Tax=unclassified Neomoorella TaxID=2676739 RepID=UPI0010FFB6C4|nr:MULTISPECIES: hypothetical protein [unclassified Moorella (in: firmicutes)]GEA15505.1 hypothetical protein E308F_17490 [Moorella sp. E308F]GEA19637.1 hypothetical protein E306M_27750 [Moorella sp. E306M]
MSKYKNTIAINNEDGKIYAVRTKKSANAYEFIDIVTSCDEITEQALNVVAKYIRDNDLGKVKTDFGHLSLSE